MNIPWELLAAFMLKIAEDMFSKFLSVLVKTVERLVTYTQLKTGAGPQLENCEATKSMTIITLPTLNVNSNKPISG